MPSAIACHTGNYLAVLALLFGAAITFDWLLIQWGHVPWFGCWLRPIFHIVLSKTVAIWAISIGVLMLLLERSRPTGTALLLAGLLIGVMPELLEGYLRPLCNRHTSGIVGPTKLVLSGGRR